MKYLWQKAQLGSALVTLMDFLFLAKQKVIAVYLVWSIEVISLRFHSFLFNPHPLTNNVFLMIIDLIIYTFFISTLQHIFLPYIYICLWPLNFRVIFIAMKESILIKHLSVYDRTKKKKKYLPLPQSLVCVIPFKRKKEMSLDKSCYKIARVDDFSKNQLVLKSIICVSSIICVIPNQVSHWLNAIT